MRREAGIAGSGPTTAVDQSGELGRVVNWIKRAYEDIQEIDPEIYFLRKDFSGLTVVANNTYDFSIPDLNLWKKDSVRCWQSTNATERYLIYRDWTEFRDLRVYGSVRDQTGLPLEFSIKPDNTLIVWPIPDQQYTIVGEYFRTPHEMLVDVDVPIFNRHQMIIVFDGLMRYAAFNSEPALYAYAQKEYSKLRGRLGVDQAPEIVLGAALA